MSKRTILVRYFGDNTAAERILNQGSMQLAYMKRSQGISLAAARALIAEALSRVPSGTNFADIFTKALEGASFHENRERLGVF